MKNESSMMNDAVKEADNFLNDSRFDGVKRLYTARQVAEQQGSLYQDYSIAKDAASEFYAKLRELY